jgi:vacuolar protein sorting-associated protein 13A/C
LARQALDAPNLAIPFRIVKGSFESLRVEVPWARLTSKPVVLRAVGLNATIEPFDHLTSNFIHEEISTPKKTTAYTSDGIKEKKAKDERFASLQHAEEARQRFNAMREITEIDEEEFEDEKSGQTRGSSSGFKARLVRRIIENIQVDIDDIQFTLKGHGCDAGIQLDRFSIFSTDKNGKKSFIDRVTNSRNIMKSFLYKALELDGLNVYLDEQRSAPKVLNTNYKPLDGENKSYILAPLSFRARLRQSDCLECIDFPKYLLAANLPNVSLRLSRSQLEVLYDITNEIQKMKYVARPLFPEYRPDIPVSKSSAKLWWKYAVRSIGRINRRRSWVEFFIAYKKRKNYISMYKRLIYSSECPWLTPLLIQERADLDSIENDKSISTKGIMAWRNMADAQVNLEIKKFEQIEASKKSKKSSPKKKTSFRSMIFGNKNKDDEILLLDQEFLDNNEPPISLSETEMRELDMLAMEAANTEFTLSTDSVLCDVTFEMGSFSIDLITFAMTPLLSLEMGTVKTVLKANADGSFSSSFALSSMNVFDRITIGTLFPSIIRSLQSSADSLLDSTFKNAIELKLTKARNGDQGFEAKLVSYEIVACDNLLKELKKFVTMTRSRSTCSGETSNPMLQYSVSGGADLFYDAGDFGSSAMFGSRFELERSEAVDSTTYNYLHSSNKLKVSDKLSSAFADAWKNKLESEVVWSIEIQLHAPIIVIPETCTHANSTVLVVDFGTLYLAYGKKLSPQIEQWFRSHVNLKGAVNADHCSIAMEHFSFQISKAGNKDWLSSRSTSRAGIRNSNSIIEPVTFNINIGVENGPLNRKCMFGVLENISLSLSHVQILETMSVLSIWSSIISSLSNKEDNEGATIITEVVDSSNQKRNGIGSNSQDLLSKYAPTALDLTHISLALQELKVTITNEINESVEAHLVSVASSSTSFSDGSSSIKLKMGHFWVLDHLNSNFPRHQRLLVHSTLPRCAEDYASSRNFNIMPDFEEYLTSNGNSFIDSLADITITKSSGCDQGDSPFHLNDISISTTSIDAKFSVLFIHWNPYTIRDLLTFQRNFIAVSDKVRTLKLSGMNSSHNIPMRLENSRALLSVNAQMEAFDLSFNSALDDLLLFHMNMSKTSVIFHSFKQNSLDDDNLMASVFVGDFRLSVPKTTKVLPEYQIILGLDDTHSTSLLELEYGKGDLAMKSCPTEASGNDIEMYMTVFLSPMRFVHIQAQVLTIAEFLTEGVLGAITEKVASSAAQAATVLTQAKSERAKLFLILAKGFNIILPQAVSNREYFSLDITKMSVNFRSLPEPGAGIADIRFQRLCMSCSRGEKLIEEPINMDVNVSLAPLSSPSPHEMATQVNVHITRISLLLSRHHYMQAMKTLDFNIGELNSFLREAELLVAEEGSTRRQRLTHGGAEEIVIKKRLYIKFHFEAMCLELCNSSSADPLIALTALKTDMDMQLIPDEDIMNLSVTLLDLDVEDRRLESSDKQFCMLIQQINNSKNSDIFKIVYSKNKKERTTSTNLTLGSPRIVFIPDAVCEVIAFFKSDAPPGSIVLEKELDIGLSPSYTKRKSIKERESDKVEFTMLTDDCSFVFIDLQTISRDNKKMFTEAIVLKGQLDLSATSESDTSTGISLKRDVQVHGENLEMVSADGPQLLKPLQILDPVKFSLFFSSNTNTDTEIIDFSFVTLTAVNSCVSMRQCALFLAVMSGARESYGLQKFEEPSDESFSSARPLTEKETGKINELALALQEQSFDLAPSEHETSYSRQSSGNTSQSSRVVKQTDKRAFKIKLTIPFSSLTVINDLQGVDEALFKIIFSSVVNNTELCLSSKSEETVFHSHTYWVIDSDYFDSHSKRWEKLIIHPWELDFKAVRGRKKNTRRMVTTVDVESHPCHISFSEQFIISIKGAQEMWNLFKGTSDRAMAIINDFEDNAVEKKELARRKAMARSATRSLTTVLPYGISNRSGMSVTYRVAIDEQFPVEETVSYFRFPLYSGFGTGGCRLYGQEATESKTVVLSVEDEEIIIDNLDADVGLGKRVHYLKNGHYIFTEAEETGKSTILYISSFMDIYNDTCLDIPISLSVGRSVVDIGLSKGASTLSSNTKAFRKAVHTKPFGVNAQVLCNAYHPNALNVGGVISLGFSPDFDDTLHGDLQLPSLQAFHLIGSRGQPKIVDVVCKSNNNAERITLRIICRVALIEDCPMVEFFIQPRLILSNESFVNITARTAMAKTASKNKKAVYSQGQRQDEHILFPFDTIQVFHSGQSVAFSFRCTDIPIGGNRTGWNKYGWIDIPLSLNARLKDRLQSSFPFLDSNGRPSNHGGGCDFFLIEEAADTLNTINHTISSHVQQMEKVRTIKISVENLGVDHTGEVLFQSWDVYTQKASASENIGDVSNINNFTFSSFASALHKRRITILPSSSDLIRILQLSIDGGEPYKRTLPFSIEDIAVCDGGLEATPLAWEDGSDSGYFAYRKLSTLNQSEIHIIPEFVIYNGGKEQVRVTIQQKYHLEISAGKMLLAKKANKKHGLVISLTFENLNLIAAPVQVDELGLKIVLLKSIKTGEPIGSVPIQTVIGSKDSRFVVKLGELKRGGISFKDKGGISRDDFLHFRVRWSQLEITFLDTSLPVDNTMIGKISYQSITKFVLNRFTLDYQRLFKEDMEEIISAHSAQSSARSQFSIIIKSVQVHDCTTSPETLFLDSDSGNYNFMDTRIRTKGDSDSCLLKIDLIEIKLGHDGERAHEITINTNEAFLWSLLDVASRTKVAISEFSSLETDIKWDNNSKSFCVSAREVDDNADDDIEEDGTYRAPRGDMLLAVKKMYVSQSAFLLSFKRQPQAARYKKVQNIGTAKILNYFTKKLNFTVDRARLKFASFSLNNVKGPPDRIIQSVKTFYMSQLKKKMFTLLTATSIDEWKQLAGRDDGKDSYVEGDILRMGGNLAGKSAGYIVKQVGKGIGSTLKTGTSELGRGIQNVTEVMGIGAVGAGVNSLVSGLGEGVSSTVEGGKILTSFFCDIYVYKFANENCCYWKSWRWREQNYQRCW